MKGLLSDFGGLTDQEFIQTPLTHLQNLYLLLLNGNRIMCLSAMIAMGWSDLNHRR